MKISPLAFTRSRIASFSSSEPSRRKQTTRERSRRAELPAGLIAHPALEQLGEADRLPDARGEALRRRSSAGPPRASGERKRRPSAGPYSLRLSTPSSVVRRNSGTSENASRNSSGRLVQSSEQSIGREHPLVGIDDERVGAVDALERPAQLGADHRRAGVGGVDVEPRARGRAAVGDRRDRDRPTSSTSSRRWRRPRPTSSSSSASARMRNASSAGILRSSMPSMRAALSAAECACSEQTTTLRPVVCRAAISAASVEVDAVSSMWPCQPLGQPDQLRDPVADEQLELGRGRRRPPEETDRVQRRGEQLREDPRLGAARPRSRRRSAGAASA